MSLSMLIPLLLILLQIFDSTPTTPLSPHSSLSLSSSSPQSIGLLVEAASGHLPRTKFVDLRTTLECHRREFTFNASRVDQLGRKCWGLVTAMSCWGRCDSMEIPDYAFPYKRSWHPVCIHKRILKKSIMLPYCDRGVDHSLREYVYTDAISCACKLCASSNASCEGVDAIGRYLVRSSQS